MNGFSPVKITLLGSAVLIGCLLLRASSPASMALAPRPGNRGDRLGRFGPSASMINRLQAVDGGGDARRARRDLQGKLQGKEPRLLQVAAMKPERLLLRRPPHVPELALPRAGILGGIGAKAPAFADLVGDVRADQVRGPFVHGTI